MHRKKQNQQNGKPEIGNGDAHLGQAHQTHIAQAVVAHCRKNTGTQGHDCRQGHGHECQRHGQAQPLQKQLTHGRAIRITVAQIAGQHAAYPGQVAFQRRAIKAQFLGQRGDGFGRGVGPHHHLGGVSRQDFENDKNDDRCPGQRANQCQDAFE